MIEIEMEQALAELQAMMLRAATPGPMFAYIGGAETEQAHARIESLKSTPLGDPWEPWMTGTARERERKGNAALGLLYDTGELLDSIEFFADSDTLEIGTDVDYAEYLQDGTRFMDARPFLGWNPERLVQYELDWADYLSGDMPA